MFFKKKTNKKKKNMISIKAQLQQLFSIIKYHQWNKQVQLTSIKAYPSLSAYLNPFLLQVIGPAEEGNGRASW